MNKTSQACWRMQNADHKFSRTEQIFQTPTAPPQIFEVPDTSLCCAAVILNLSRNFISSAAGEGRNAGKLMAVQLEDVFCFRSKCFLCRNLLKFFCFCANALSYSLFHWRNGCVSPTAYFLLWLCWKALVAECIFFRYICSNVLLLNLGNLDFTAKL